jgi:uroporphyrinogen-III decarboxylase
MADAHLAALDAFEFDWVMVGMGLIGGIIPESMGCEISYPEDVFPIIKKRLSSPWPILTPLPGSMYIPKGWRIF